MAEALGHPQLASRWLQQAERLAERFNAAFWSDDLGTCVLALDGMKQPCQVRSSNAGQVLLSGIASQPQAAAVAAQLMSQPFFSGWGIRTVAQSEARFNPMSYHNGSIWPHDNALIALGMARYGLIDPVLKLFSGLNSAASHSYITITDHSQQGSPIAWMKTAWRDKSMRSTDSTARLRAITILKSCEFDIERIVDAAKKGGCFLGVNASPSRLDLNDIHCRLAKERGVKLAISTDVHAPSQLQQIRDGLDQARLAGKGRCPQYGDMAPIETTSESLVLS